MSEWKLQLKDGSIMPFREHFQDFAITLQGNDIDEFVPTPFDVLIPYNNRGTSCRLCTSSLSSTTMMLAQSPPANRSSQLISRITSTISRSPSSRISLESKMSSALNPSSKQPTSYNSRSSRRSASAPWALNSISATPRRNYSNSSTRYLSESKV
jgi:hypothetical protein